MERPTFIEEHLLWKQGLNHIAGVDEVGRGCFAGPVVAAAVIFSPSSERNLKEVNDSKKLSSKKRLELAEVVRKEALSYSIAEVSVGVINKIGIGKATQVAFVNAVNGLQIRPDYIFIDAFYIQNLSRHNQKPIKHGDGTSLTIAAASIIAKVHRDQIMQNLPDQYVHYDFFTNKGYGTKKHQEAIRRFGLSDLHRRSFNLAKFIS